jgi:hypothetical protein
MYAGMHLVLVVLHEIGQRGARDPGREQSSPPWGFPIDVVSFCQQAHLFLLKGRVRATTWFGLGVP